MVPKRKSNPVVVDASIGFINIPPLLSCAFKTCFLHSIHVGGKRERERGASFLALTTLYRYAHTPLQHIALVLLCSYLDCVQMYRPLSNPESRDEDFSALFSL